MNKFQAKYCSFCKENPNMKGIFLPRFLPTPHCKSLLLSNVMRLWKIWGLIHFEIFFEMMKACVSKECCVLLCLMMCISTCPTCHMHTVPHVASSQLSHALCLVRWFYVAMVMEDEVKKNPTYVILGDKGVRMGMRSSVWVWFPKRFKRCPGSLWAYIR